MRHNKNIPESVEVGAVYRLIDGSLVRVTAIVGSHGIRCRKGWRRRPKYRAVYTNSTGSSVQGLLYRSELRREHPV